MYKKAIYFFSFSLVLLLAIAFWMKASDIDLHGAYVRGGQMHGNTLTPGGVFFIAMVFAAILIYLLKLDRKERKEREDGKDHYGNYPKY